MDLPDGKQFFLAIKELCHSTNETYDLDALSLRTHEEADTQMFVHAHDASLILIG